VGRRAIAAPPALRELPVDKQQWIALALLVVTLFVVMLDATRAFSEPAPGLVPASLQDVAPLPAQRPLQPPAARWHVVRKSFA
jgi:hypothetical protein